MLALDLPADLVLPALAEQVDEIEDIAIADERWRDRVESGSLSLEVVMRRHDLAD